jgi:glycosyltransferase A (GT-A) superfamily protein (DUF2064 family)
MLAIAVLARRPMTGSALKTLVPPLAPAEAGRLARAFLEDTLAAVLAWAPGGARKLVAYAPRDAEPWFASLLATVGHGFELWPQPEGEAEERLAGTAAFLYEHRADAIVLVTAESPLLPRSALESVVSALGAGADVAVVPVAKNVDDESDDDSFQLLGLTRKAYDSPSDAFTEAACAQAGLHRALLPPLRGVETTQDLERLCAALLDNHALAPATHKVLVTLGKLPVR